MSKATERGKEEEHSTGNNWILLIESHGDTAWVLLLC